MMKSKKLFTLLLVALLSASALFAASSAEKIYSEFDDAAKDGDIALSMKKWEELGKRVEKEIATANKSLETARRKNDGNLYRNASMDIRRLTSYSISSEQTDALLGAIVNLSDESAKESDATWLYENSAYYRPTLTLKTEQENGNSKSVSTRSFSCKPGTEITLPEKSGISASLFGRLSGWGIVPDEKTYEPGEKITMPYTSQTLYSIFEDAVSFGDEKTVLTGDEETIGVPKPEEKENSYFMGWYDRSSGIFISPDEAEWEIKGKGAEFTPLYEEISFKEVHAKPYDLEALPKNTQIMLSFPFENSGTETLKGLKVEVSEDSGSVSILEGTGFLRSLRPGKPATLRGVILVIPENVPSGSTLTLNAKVTLENGHEFTKSFDVKVK